MTTIKKDLIKLVHEHDIGVAIGIPDWAVAQYLMYQIKTLYETQKEINKYPKNQVQDRIFL